MDLSILILHNTINRFREYLELVEKSIVEKKVKFSEEMEDQAAGMSPEEKEEFLEHYSDDYWAYDDDYPDLLRKSIFTASFSLLEHRMISLCKRFKSKKNLDLDVNEITGSGLMKAQIYLKKVAGIPFPDDSQLWADMLVYQYIRNLIIHNDSTIKESKETENIKNFILKNSTIKLKNSRIIFEKEFCVQVLRNIEEFLVIVYSGMPSKEFWKKAMKEID